MNRKVTVLILQEWSACLKPGTKWQCTRLLLLVPNAFKVMGYALLITKLFNP